MIQSPLAGHGAMLLFSSLVAGSFSLGSLAATLIDPIALTAVRFLIAAIVVSAMARAMFGFQRNWLDAPWRYAALGATMSLYFVLMFVALQTATPVSTAAVFTLAPLFSAVFGWFLLRQITDRWIAGALAIGAVGALWVIFRGDMAALLALDIGRGEIIFIIGCASHALYAPLVPFLKRDEPTLVFTAGMLIAGTGLLVIIGAPALLATVWTALPPFVWGVIAYLSLATTALTFYLVQFAAQRLPASKVMAYTYLIPTWVIIWEAALGHGLPATRVIFGMVLTTTALVMLLRR